MKKYLFVIGMTLMLLVVGLSGCTDVDFGEVTQFSITKFNVEPALITVGDTANLSWVVMSAQIISIDNGIGNVSNIGDRIIMPTETTIYTLTAKNGTKTITATTEIIVKNNTDNNQDEEPPIGETPTITFTKDEAENTLTVVQADVGIAWGDINMTVTGTGGPYYTTGLASGDIVTAGDTICFDSHGLSGDITIRFAYIPTNALIGTYKLSNVYL